MPDTFLGDQQRWRRTHFEERPPPRPPTQPPKTSFPGWRGRRSRMCRRYFSPPHSLISPPFSLRFGAVGVFLVAPTAWCVARLGAAGPRALAALEGPPVLALLSAPGRSRLPRPRLRALRAARRERAPRRHLRAAMRAVRGARSPGLAAAARSGEVGGPPLGSGAARGSLPASGAGSRACEQHTARLGRCVKARQPLRQRR